MTSYSNYPYLNKQTNKNGFRVNITNKVSVINKMKTYKQTLLTARPPFRPKQRRRSGLPNDKRKTLRDKDRGSHLGTSEEWQ